MEREIKLKNALKILVWIIGFICSYILVYRMTEYHYQYVAAKSQIEIYQLAMGILWIGGAVVASIWWILLVCMKNKIRNYAEENAFVCGLLFGAAVLLWTFYITGMRVSGIMDNNGKLQYVYYGFVMPCVFGALMVLLPPEGVKKVIIPGSAVIKWIIGGVFLLLAAAILWIG